MTGAGIGAWDRERVFGRDRGWVGFQKQCKGLDLYNVFLGHWTMADTMAELERKHVRVCIYVYIKESDSLNVAWVVACLGQEL
jgi:hypothetical protein